MEKLRGLLSVFQTNLTDLEQRQSQARGVAQKGLKKEMVSLQQKAIKKAVSLSLPLSHSTQLLTHTHN